MPVIRIRMLRPFSWLVILHAAILGLALALLVRQ